MQSQGLHGPCPPLAILLEEQQQVLPRYQEWLCYSQRSEVMVHSAELIIAVRCQNSQLIVRISASRIDTGRCLVEVLGFAPILGGLG